eukprot:11465695-Prorocentrum_lima.AAC.1
MCIRDRLLFSTLRGMGTTASTIGPSSLAPSPAQHWCTCASGHRKGGSVPPPPGHAGSPTD